MKLGAEDLLHLDRQGTHVDFVSPPRGAF